MKTSKSFRVIMLTGLTVALEVLLGIWFEQRSYEGRPLHPSIEPIVSWTIIISATAVFIVILGSTRLSTWFIAVLFVVGTVLGSLLVGQAVLSHYIYKRDFTYRSHQKQMTNAFAAKSCLSATTESMTMR